MNDAEMYQISNQLQKRDAASFLDEFSSKIKWKKDNIRVLDIGCGDGGVTAILKKYIPGDHKLVGCDISEEMVNYANINHRDERTSFTVLDIEGRLPEGFKGGFDNVFSFYALHWIIDQQRAFSNIYELMSGAGDCFMIFVAGTPVYDVYRILARSNIWSPWIHSLDRFISPYNDMQEPENLVREMLEKIGFVDINVESRNLVFTYENMDTARKALKSICPFEIPKDLCDDFMDDYVEAFKELGMLHKIDDHTETLYHKYRLLIVHAWKQIPIIVDEKHC